MRGPYHDAPMTPDPQPSPSPAPFRPDWAHHQQPKLRAVRGFPAQVGNQMALGLADARQVSDKVVFAAPAAQMILPLLDGTRSLEQIVGQVGRGLTKENLEQLIGQLDDAGLLFGPTFDAILAKMRSDFDASDSLPPASTAAYADALAQQSMGEQFATASLETKDEVGAKRLRETMDEWMAAALKDVQSPSFDVLPKGIVAPHLDYPRGWLNYASVYGRLRVTDRPDRVVVLGTNHFGEATGVCGCNKGYETPFGLVEADRALISTLEKNLGPDDAGKLFANRFDHEREHSIELQIPWLQHVFGKDESGKFVPVFGVLIHDPSVNGGESYDGKGLAFEPFVKALKATVESLPGKTLFVASADLSHVGPAFGETFGFAGPLVGEEEAVVEARNRIFNHDRELLGLFVQGKTDEMIASMAWQQNPTRWCSLGNLTAAVALTGSKKIEVFNYAAAMDQQGSTMVSSFSAALA